MKFDEMQRELERENAQLLEQQAKAPSEEQIAQMQQELEKLSDEMIEEDARDAEAAEADSPTTVNSNSKLTEGPEDENKSMGAGAGNESDEDDKRMQEIKKIAQDSCLNQFWFE